MHAALNSSKSCCSNCEITKVERLIKGGRALSMQLQGHAPAACMQRVTRGVQGQENPNEEYASWNLTVFFFFPQSKILCIKKKIKLCACIDLKEI